MRRLGRARPRALTDLIDIAREDAAKAGPIACQEGAGSWSDAMF
jgi:hypothetical protein